MCGSRDRTLSMEVTQFIVAKDLQWKEYSLQEEAIEDDCLQINEHVCKYVLYKYLITISWNLSNITKCIITNNCKHHH